MVALKSRRQMEPHAPCTRQSVSHWFTYEARVAAHIILLCETGVVEVERVRRAIPRTSGWAALAVTVVSILACTFTSSDASEAGSPVPIKAYGQVTGAYGQVTGPEIEERISRLEGNWQHLRISGGISLGFSAYEGQLPGEIDAEGDVASPQRFPTQTQVGGRNRIQLNLVAGVSEAIEVSARLAGDSLWGVNYPGELALAPIAAPSLLRLEEFAAVYRTDTVWLLAGKQTFSMGPLGLLVSNTMEPVDLIDAAVAWNGFVASAIGARLSSEYYIGTDYVINTDNYVSVRVEKELAPGVLLGLNGLLSGVGDASGQSIDLQSRVLGRPATIELARYNPGNTITQGSYQDAYAWLARVQVLDTSATSASVSYGRADKGFTPAFSSIASSSGATENLIHNTQNLTASLSRDLGAGFSIAGEISVSRFLDQEFASEARMGEVYPLLTAGVTVSKRIAPYSVLNATVSHTSNEAASFRRFGVDLHLNF